MGLTQPQKISLQSNDYLCLIKTTLVVYLIDVELSTRHFIVFQFGGILPPDGGIQYLEYEQMSYTVVLTQLIIVFLDYAISNFYFLISNRYILELKSTSVL